MNWLMNYFPTDLGLSREFETNKNNNERRSVLALDTELSATTEEHF